MRLSLKQLQKFRSGQTVWRIIVRTNDGGKTLEARIEREWFIGKKTHVHLYGDRPSIRFRWAAYDKLMAQREAVHKAGVRYSLQAKIPTWMYGYPHFLNDSHGDACFTSKRQADRFVKEVEKFMHPDMTDRAMQMWDWDEMDRRYGMDDDYPDDYPEVKVFKIKPGEQAHNRKTQQTAKMLGPVEGDPEKMWVQFKNNRRAQWDTKYCEKPVMQVEEAVV